MAGALFRASQVLTPQSACQLHLPGRIATFPRQISGNKACWRGALSVFVLQAPLQSDRRISVAPMP